MTDLKETDEPVEKAGKTGARSYRGVRMSAAQRRQIASGKLKPGSRIIRNPDGKSYLLPGWGRKGNLSAHIVRKSSDPLAELDTAIEKAKGLISGGSRKTLRRIADRAHKDPKNSRLARAYRYMAHRNPSERKGVYKSALGELDAAIQKAKPLLARQKNGTRAAIINGRRVKLSRPTKAWGGRKFSMSNPVQPGKAYQLKETTYSLPSPGGDNGFRRYQRAHIKNALARLKAQPHPSTIAPGGGRINSKRKRK